MKAVTRVTFKKKGNFILAIEHPDVYKTQGGSYVVFGEAKVEDLNKRYAEAMAAQKVAQEAAKQGEEAEKLTASGSAAEAITEDLKKASLEDDGDEKKDDEDDEKEEDATGLEAGDIDVIVEQTNVSRNKAIKALREHKGDVVNAIMSLTQ
ncbi:hypothetical protein FOA43_001059 [Brettanomyces nanus]|uniref:Nascent polypeptide-associated complex subunit alpha n=1 Tax=Eeniella nana TaxID=13502 RepID=A0A875RXG0_EENNA|nr:uncharacterized protein FOA43_001059 [Brettanomyces nanus]QPG73746.1 hypothetical protein FOA43_001059 [Brettanomyces nanus]